MRVSLIIPPSGFLIDDRVFPALGILKVGAVLEAAGHEVRMLDLCGVPAADVPAHVAAHIQTPSDVYGLTATTPQMPLAAAIAAQLRALAPAARVLLGGPHVTLMQASARQEVKRGEVGRARQQMAALHERFDVLVCGDGEAAVFRAIAGPADLIDADDPKSDLFLSSAALGELPLPARHLIDLHRYHYEIDGVRAQSLIGQLGCPFGCHFCGGRRSPFLRRIRSRTAGQIIAEMRALYDTYGTRGFMFFDDELNVNVAFMELLAGMVSLQDDLGVEFRIRGFLKAELLTAEMAAAMFLAGFRQVLVGFESGDPRILQNIQKKATREDNTRAVEVLKAAGIRVKAAMSIGHPGETAETVDATRRWLLEVQPDQFDVTIITVYPGTPYYDDARETQPGVWTYRDPRNGDALHAYLVDQFTHENFYKGVPGAYRSFVFTDALSPTDLCAIRDDVEADVRNRLAIPYPTAVPDVLYEHSMGQ